MTVSARDVAAALRDRLPGLPTTKLHKLLYYCQGHHVAVFGEPLFRETISAWDMGPVVGELWREEKLGEPGGPVAHLPEGALNTVGYVVSRYGRLSGNDLVRLTHGEPPWQRADADRRPGTRTKIRVEWIRDYVASAPQDDEDDEPVADAEALAEWLSGAQVRREEPARPDDIAAIRARLVRAE